MAASWMTEAAWMAGTFLDRLAVARRGLLRACPASPAIKELEHFRATFEADLEALDPGWEGLGARHRAGIKAAFRARTRLLSYGTLYLVCQLARLL